MKWPKCSAQPFKYLLQSSSQLVTVWAEIMKDRDVHRSSRNTDDPAVNVFFHTFLTGSHLMTS